MGHFPHSIKRNGSPGRQLLKEPIMDNQTHELPVKQDGLNGMPILSASQSPSLKRIWITALFPALQNLPCTNQVQRNCGSFMDWV
jgi:hypothetical protein